MAFDNRKTTTTKRDVHLGNMTLVNTVFKTERFISYHTTTVAKAEQNFFSYRRDLCPNNDHQ